MPTFHSERTTTATPEQFIAGLADFVLETVGKGRLETRLGAVGR